MAEFERAGISRGLAERIMEFASIRGRPEEALAKLSELGIRSELAEAGVRELEGVAEALEAMGKLGKCVFDMGIVRGIGYYDGAVFEVFDRASEDVGAVVGGGRFDRLCAIYGRPDLPATGAAGGIERLMISLERAGLVEGGAGGPLAFVAYASPQVKAEAMKAVSLLRSSGVSAEFDLRGRPLGKQLEYADSIGARFAVIIGRRELERGLVRLKDMAKGSEEELRLEDAIRRILASA